MAEQRQIQMRMKSKLRCYNNRQPLLNVKQAFLVFLSLLLTFSLVLPALAFAEVRQADVIGNDTVEGRGLNVTQAPDIDAFSGMLIAEDGTVLWSRKADDTASIASVTKIMTAVVAIEKGDLNQTITITREAAAVGESSAGLVAGAQTTLHNLLYGLLISSGNDAAVAIAIGVGGSLENFVSMMNEKAAELGMTNTVFENPHGLDQGNHHSCARDIAVLSQYAMKKELFREIVCNYNYTIDLGSGEVTLHNTNSLLVECDGVIGIKTGFTDPAGFCLSSAANRDGLELYSIILGSSNAEDRVLSSAALLNWGYEHYFPVTLTDTTTTIATVPSLDWIDKSIPVAAKEAITTYVLDYNGPISQYISLIDVKGNVQVGDTLGTVTWTQGGKVIGTSSLVAQEECVAPSFFKQLAIWFQRTFTDNPHHEEASIVCPPPTIKVPFSTASAEAA